MFDIFSKLASNKIKSFSAIFLWIILIGVIAFLTPSLSEVTTNDRQDFLPVDSESINYLQMKNEKFPREDGLPGTLVFYNESGFDNKQLDLINSFLTKIQTENKYENIFQITSIFNTPLARSNLLSEDKTTMLSIITFAGDPASEKFEKTIEWIREESEFLNQKNPNLETEIHLTGPAGILVDAIKVFKSIDLRITITTVILVLVLLIIIYRSPILAILPLVIVGSSLFLSQSIAAFLSEAFDLPLNGQVTGIMSVLVFGAGTNYALFISIKDTELHGMIHYKDLSWSEKESELEKYKKNQIVKFKILEINQENEKIRLGVKQLTEDPYDFFLQKKLGDIVTAIVDSSTKNGIYVHVGNKNLSIFIKQNQLAKEIINARPSRFTRGDRVDSMIIEKNDSKKTITLSIKALEEKQTEYAVKKYGSKDSGGILGEILEPLLRKKPKSKK